MNRYLIPLTIDPRTSVLPASELVRGRRALLGRRGRDSGGRADGDGKKDVSAVLVVFRDGDVKTPLEKVEEGYFKGVELGSLDAADLGGELQVAPRHCAVRLSPLPIRLLAVFCSVGKAVLDYRGIRARL